MVTFFVYKVVAPIKFDGNCSREFMVFMQPAGGWAVLYLAASATLFFFFHCPGLLNRLPAVLATKQTLNFHAMTGLEVTSPEYEILVQSTTYSVNFPSPLCQVEEFASSLIHVCNYDLVWSYRSTQLLPRGYEPSVQWK